MTPKQKTCLEAIRTMTVDGVPPTFEELRLALGLASKSGVHRMINSLVDQGHVGRVEGAYRTLRVIGQFDDAALNKMSHAELVALRNQIDQRLAA